MDAVTKCDELKAKLTLQHQEIEDIIMKIKTLDDVNRVCEQINFAAELEYDISLCYSNERLNTDRYIIKTGTYPDGKPMPKDKVERLKKALPYLIQAAKFTALYSRADYKAKSYSELVRNRFFLTSTYIENNWAAFRKFYLEKGSYYNLQGEFSTDYSILSDLYNGHGYAILNHEPVDKNFTVAVTNVFLLMQEQQLKEQCSKLWFLLKLYQQEGEQENLEAIEQQMYTCEQLLIKFCTKHNICGNIVTEDVAFVTLSEQSIRYCIFRS